MCLWLATMLVLAACASPGGRSPDAVPSTSMSDQLIQAAADGDTATVIALLEGGADIDWQGDDGRTAVMAATVGNHADTVRALIDAEANVDIRDARLDNPFLYAGAEGLLDILRLTDRCGRGSDAHEPVRRDGPDPGLGARARGGRPGAARRTATSMSTTSTTSAGPRCWRRSS